MANRISISDVSPEILDEPVTKRDLAEFMTQVRLQAVLVDNAVMAAFRQDRAKLLEYLDKLSKHYDLVDESYNLLLGAPLQEVPNED